MKNLYIDNRLVGEGQPCYIIAEAGVNHNGQPELARKLVDIAVDAKANAVKFQKRTIEAILVAEALQGPYLGRNSFGSTYGEHRQRLELSEETYRELAAYCKEKGITLLASAWDKRSVDFLDELGVPAYKIPSADLINLPLVGHIARKRKPVIMSTGMSNMEEIADAVACVRKHHDQLILMQCTSTYPCENDQINLRVMDTFRRQFDVLVGYSGHERGLAPSEAAAALGAVVIERHFTVDRTLPGPDHAASLEPRGLQVLVRNIRNIEAALGSPEKKLLDSEQPVRQRLAKSVAAACHIRPGTEVTSDMLTVKGPGSGISPRHLPLLIGVVAQADVPADTLLPKEALSWR